MRPDYNGFRERYLEFFRNWETAYNLEEKLFRYLLSEVYNDLLSKNIKTLGDWLKFYSNDSNDFSVIVKHCNSYYEKILRGEFDKVSFEERLIGFNAFAVYMIEMDIDLPKNDTKLQGFLMATLIETVLNYDLFLKGYLSLNGNPHISNRKSIRFYSVWEAGGVRKEQPITLF
jgi:hypothetical protein